MREERNSSSSRVPPDPPCGCFTAFLPFELQGREVEHRLVRCLDPPRHAPVALQRYPMTLPGKDGGTCSP